MRDRRSAQPARRGEAVRQQPVFVRRRRRRRQQQGDRQEQREATSSSSRADCPQCPAVLDQQLRHHRRRRSPRAPCRRCRRRRSGRSGGRSRSAAMPRSSRRWTKRRALGLRADQAEEGEVAAAQDRLGDAQVERVLVGQHEVERAGRRVPHLGLDRVDADPADVRRPGRAERRSSPGIPSSRSSIQSTSTSSVASSVRDRAADVAGAVELQVEAAARLAGQRASAAASSGAKRSVTAPPQHWPSDGPSAKRCSLRRGLAAREHRARRGDRLQLEVAAADRAERVVGATPACACRPRAAPSRASATTSTTTARRPSRQPGDGEIADARGRSRRARRPAPRSPRAGSPRWSPARAAADRRDGRRPPRPRRGSRRTPRTAAAAAARRPPCCGGCCRRRCWPSNSRTLKTGGQSLAVGIL